MKSVTVLTRPFSQYIEVMVVSVWQSKGGLEKVKLPELKEYGLIVLETHDFEPVISAHGRAAEKAPVAEAPQRTLSAPGSGQMQYAKALMLSRPYFTRIPDQSIIAGGAGRGEPHIGATRDRDGRYAMIYLPQGQKVSVDLSKISGKTAVAWWFDPRNGQAIQIDDNVPTSEARTFEPPSSGADTDWMLILDDKSQGFAPPGVTSR